MFSRSVISGSTLIAAAVCAAAQTTSAAVVVSFDNNLADNPFRTSVVNSATMVTGSVIDPDLNGGTSVTLTLSNPLQGVDIATPDSPDFSGATLSYFGAEGSGIGVGNPNLGRFERGEAFTLHTTHALTLNSFGFHEYNGDEELHISWIENGVAQSAVFSMAGGTGVTSNATVTLSGIQADANTSLTITNVSSASANAAGRLRFRRMEISLVPEPATLGLLGIAPMMLLRRRRPAIA